MKSSKILLISLGIIIAASIVLFLVVFFSVESKLQNELLKETAKILLQLILIGVLGTFAKYLFDQYAAERQKQMEKHEKQLQDEKERFENKRTINEARHKAKLEALNSLTTSYWEIKKAFHIISAHRSAKSYGEQIRNIIDYRLKFQRLHNEIKAGLYYFDDKDIKTISENLDTIETCLGEVVDEWRSEYLRLSQLQKKDEITEDPKKKQVPNQIDALPVLNKIKADQFAAIHTPFKNAAKPIRKQLMESMKGFVS